MLDRGASPSEKVEIAVKDTEFAEVRQLIGMGKRINVVELSPVAVALLRGHSDIVGLLLGAGVDKNEKLPNGNTLLKEATLMGDTKLMNLLMEHGAAT
jgi:ankyrin repeat protein